MTVYTSLEEVPSRARHKFSIGDEIVDRSHYQKGWGKIIAIRVQGTQVSYIISWERYGCPSYRKAGEIQKVGSNGSENPTSNPES